MDFCPYFLHLNPSLGILRRRSAPARRPEPPAVQVKPITHQSTFAFVPHKHFRFIRKHLQVRARRRGGRVAPTNTLSCRSGGCSPSGTAATTMTAPSRRPGPSGRSTPSTEPCSPPPAAAPRALPRCCCMAREQRRLAPRLPSGSAPSRGGILQEAVVAEELAYELLVEFARPDGRRSVGGLGTVQRVACHRFGGSYQGAVRGLCRRSLGHVSKLSTTDPVERITEQGKHLVRLTVYRNFGGVRVKQCWSGFCEQQQ
jgi:hypothetical protein